MTKDTRHQCLTQPPQNLDEIKFKDIGLDKSGYQVNSFLISPQKYYVVVLIKAPWRGTSNEYPQHMFFWRNKKNINTFGLKKKSHLIKSCVRRLDVCLYELS